MRAGELVGGKYRLEERLGSGSHAQVWRAMTLANGAEIGLVAVKFFSNLENVGELSLLQRLAHEHLIALRGFETHEGRLCVVMEYAEGGSAEALLKAYPTGMPSDQVRKIVAQVAAGLSYLHREQVVHRDVKPANVVFAAGRAKLCDVGIARALADLAHARREGTLAYAAPEMLAAGRTPAGSPEVTAAVDVFALGVTAFELLTGRLPFGDTEAEILRRMAVGAPAIPLEVDPFWQALFAGCLALEPSERWPIDRVLDSLRGVPLAPAPAPAAAPARPPTCAECGRPHSALQGCPYLGQAEHELPLRACHAERCPQCLERHKAHHSVQKIAGHLTRLFRK